MMSSRAAIRSSLFHATPQPDPKIDAPDLLQNDIVIGKLCRPFQRKADTKTAGHK